MSDDLHRERLRELVEAFGRLHGLSRRERSILAFSLQEPSIKDVASVAGCQPATVNVYWLRIRCKTGAQSRLHVVAMLLNLALAPVLKPICDPTCKQNRDVRDSGARERVIEHPDEKMADSEAAATSLPDVVPPLPQRLATRNG
jgi:DNA-binding CsgD family transcriptional regulator